MAADRLDEGIPTEAVRFKGFRGRSLAGVLYPSSPGRLVVFVAGLQPARGKFERLAYLLSRTDCSLLAFDSGGLGDSHPGPVSIPAIASDLAAAVDYARSRGFAKIALWGNGFGSAFCVCAEVRPTALVLASPGGVFQAALPIDPDEIDQRYEPPFMEDVKRLQADSAQRVGELPCPTLFVFAHDYVTDRQRAGAENAVARLPAGSAMQLIQNVNPLFSGYAMDRVMAQVAPWLVGSFG